MEPAPSGNAPLHAGPPDDVIPVEEGCEDWVAVLAGGGRGGRSRVPGGACRTSEHIADDDADGHGDDVGGCDGVGGSGNGHGGVSGEGWDGTALPTPLICLPGRGDTKELARADAR